MTLDVSGAVAGLSCARVVGASGPVVVVAGCTGSDSIGNGARVSDGSALDTIGVSTLGEFVVIGPGVFSVFAFVCGAAVSVFAVSGCDLADLFKARPGAGIGLGSMDGADDSVLATSFDGATGAEATCCCACSQPTS